ncbi:MAG: hypothetical protein GY798_02175 [Hyphomicrobiales bacterium]|nr:hypothetical protein [Hyphomicrobiales bacterium]
MDEVVAAPPRLRKFHHLVGLPAENYPHIPHFPRHTLTQGQTPGVAACAATYNANWLRERHDHKTPDQIRAEQLGLETAVTMEHKMAAYLDMSLSSGR